jgi:hypothetical protein
LHITGVWGGLENIVEGEFADIEENREENRESGSGELPCYVISSYI